MYLCQLGNTVWLIPVIPSEKLTRENVVNPREGATADAVTAEQKERGTSLLPLLAAQT